MKDKNILNRNIKDQFDRERLEPPAFIWENVKTSIDAGKKRKIFPFWIILAIVGGLALDFYLPQKVQEKNIETKTEFSTKQQNIASTTSVNQAVENNANELTNKTLASNSNVSNVRNSSIENIVNNSSKSANQKKINNILNQKQTPKEAEEIVQNENLGLKNTSEQSNNSENKYANLIVKADEEKSEQATRELWTAINPIDALTPNLLEISDNQLRMGDCYSFKNKRKKSANGFEFYGLGMINQQLLSAKNAAADNYMTNRKITENNGVAYGVGIAFRYYFNQSIFVKAGLQYQDRITYFNYTNNDEVKIDSLGRIINGTRIKKTTNIFNHIELPIMVGYQQNLGRFNLNFAGGIGIGIWNKRKGDILNSSIRPININSGTVIGDSLYTSGTSSSLIFNAALEYKFTPKYHLFIRPTLQYYFKDISTTNNPISEKYLTYGLQAGLFVKL